MKKIAFVTGMTGQDGPYLAKHLLENEYKNARKWNKMLDNFKKCKQKKTCYKMLQHDIKWYKML